MSYLLKVVLASSLSVCQLFSNPFTPCNDTILDVMTQHDLDLVSRKEQTLSSVIDKTITNSGKKMLSDLLLNPTDNTDILVERQASTTFLLERKPLMSKLQKQLALLADNESSLQVPSDDLGKKSLDRVYFSSSQLKHLNNSAYGLDLAYALNIVGRLSPLFEHMVMHRVINYWKKKKPNSCHLDHDHVHHNHDASCTDLSQESFDSELIYRGIQIFHLIYHLPSFYFMLCDIKEQATIIKCVQSRMIKIAQYTRCAESMHKLLSKNKAYDAHFQPFIELDTFFGEKQTCSEEFKQLCTLLNKATFSGKASLLSHPGNVLAAFVLFNKVENEFATITKAISEIDIYLNIARVFANQKPEAPWCFATFSNTEQPELELKKVRHLFVSESNPSNFSSKNGAHSVIMGDNGSGKSTYLFSIGHALILAQTFGIAPAESCELTPFSHIYTFRFIQDNMFEKTSRFYAECARTEKIIDTIQRDSKPAFVIFDEPFTYTNFKKGSTYLQKMLSDLSPLSNTISLVATHYNAIGATEESGWKKVFLGVNH